MKHCLWVLLGNRIYYYFAFVDYSRLSLVLLHVLVLFMIVTLIIKNLLSGEIVNQKKHDFAEKRYCYIYILLCT